MKSGKPNVYQKRLEAILEQYRDKDVRQAADGRHLRRLWREFVYPMRWQLFLAGALSLFISLQPYYWTTVFRFVVDDLLMVGQTIPPGEMDTHVRWILYLFAVNCGVHILVITLSWKSSYLMTMVGQRVVFEMRKALHERLQRLPLSFFDATQTGRLLSVVLDDVWTIQSSIGGLAVSLTNNVALVVVGYLYMAALNWKLALVALAAMPIYVVNFLYFRPKIRDGNITARRANTALYNKVEERITAIRTVKVFGRERAEVKTFAEAANNLARLTIHVVRLGTWQNIVANVVLPLTTGLVLYFGALAYRHGEVSLGTVLQFGLLVQFVFQPAVAVSDLLGMELPRVSVVLRRVFDLLDARQEPEDRPDAIDLPQACGTIIFDHVTFTFPGDETPTLQDVTFAVHAGKQVAIMGPSGAGKSTLLYLLMRFYDPDTGLIRLDGLDLRETKLLSLRDRITLVMQEPVIFSGSVAENIRYGRLDASDEDVRRAARDADLHEFILTLPDGYETIVGERGMSLSGGQRQRLALAASLLSRPSVLLLDDTTSALDPVTEAKVRTTLNRIMKKRTCFVVTHRVSTAMASDLVLVLEDGRLTQFGTPADLLQQPGLFQRVYAQQQRESVSETVEAPTAKTPVVG